MGSVGEDPWETLGHPAHPNKKAHRDAARDRAQNQSEGCREEYERKQSRLKHC